jgi:hypothetical protein
VDSDDDMGGCGGTDVLAGLAGLSPGGPGGHTPISAGTPVSRVVSFVNQKSDLQLAVTLAQLVRKQGRGRPLSTTHNGHLEPFRSSKPSFHSLPGGKAAAIEFVFLVVELPGEGDENRFSGLCSICATLYRGAEVAQRWEQMWLQLGHM